MQVLVVNQEEVPRAPADGRVHGRDGGRAVGARARRGGPPAALDPLAAGEVGGLGLMPAALVPAKALGVKVVTFFPGNEGTELDSHQGAVLLFEAERGQPPRGDRRDLDHRDPHRRRQRAWRRALLAREDAGDLAILGSGVQARTHLEAMRESRARSAASASRAKTCESAQAVRARASPRGTASPIEPVDSVREAVAGADIICTATSSREPVLLGEWIAPGAHVNAVGRERPGRRELDTAAVVRVAPLRRPPRVGAERGGRLPHPDEGGGDRRRPHRRRDRRGPPRAASTDARPADDITLFKSLGIAVEDLASARAHLRARRRRHGTGARLDFGGRRATRTIEPPTIDEIRAARERIAGGRAPHPARPPERRRRSRPRSG